MLQTVDVYDALTTDRPYRKALSSERAFTILRDEVRRGWWDGRLVSEFEMLLKESPEIGESSAAKDLLHRKQVEIASATIPDELKQALILSS